MTDPDIVARLRGHIAIITRIDYSKDGYTEPVYAHGPSPICQEAANEIERLRAERDEARRMVCALDADIMEDQMEYARHRGWDCYKEVKP